MPEIDPFDYDINGNDNCPDRPGCSRPSNVRDQLKSEGATFVEFKLSFKSHEDLMFHFAQECACGTVISPHDVQVFAPDVANGADDSKRRPRQVAAKRATKCKQTSKKRSSKTRDDDYNEFEGMDRRFLQLNVKPAEYEKPFDDNGALKWRIMCPVCNQHEDDDDADSRVPGCLANRKLRVVKVGYQDELASKRLTAAVESMRRATGVAKVRNVLDDTCLQDDVPQLDRRLVGNRPRGLIGWDALQPGTDTSVPTTSASMGKKTPFKEPDDLPEEPIPGVDELSENVKGMLVLSNRAAMYDDTAECPNCKQQYNNRSSFVNRDRTVFRNCAQVGVLRADCDPAYKFAMLILPHRVMVYYQTKCNHCEAVYSGDLIAFSEKAQTIYRRRAEARKTYAEVRRLAPRHSAALPPLKRLTRFGVKKMRRKRQAALSRARRRQKRRNMIDRKRNS